MKLPIDFLPLVLENGSLCLVSDNQKGVNLQKQLEFFSKEAVLLKESDDTFATEADRIKTLCKLCDDDFKGIVIATPKSFKSDVQNKLSLIGESVLIKQGLSINRDKLIQLLISKGYRRAEIVFEVSEFAVRGSIIDIFLAGENHPIRCDFFGDAIESIKVFNQISQTTIEKTNKTFFIHPISFSNSTLEPFKNYVKGMKIVSYEVSDADIEIDTDITFSEKGVNAKEGKNYSGLPNYLNEVIRDLKSYKMSFIACQSNGSRERIINMLEEHAITPVDYYKDAQINKIHAIVVPFLNGFTSKDICMISEDAIFGKKSKKQPKKTLASFQSFDVLDLLVHDDHGIGRYLGLKTVVVDNCPHDCLEIEYEGGDKLFLPVENMDLISKYGEDSTPLDKLGNTNWQQKKAKIKNRIRLVSKYLLETAAKRALKVGEIFETKKEDYEEFVKKFPYQETDDQQNAIDEVLKDLSSGKPMDRLICGDVGFGKTEVALRAAFVVASNYFQVAIISPTTLLCLQHAKTFEERFKNTKLKVVMLSRMTKNSKQAREMIQNGEAGIIVATHAALSETFLNLGLLIVDEEHRFGVKQKEKLKELGNSVHVLSLSATPIPRTLQMSLTGVRDLSLITTPPISRLSVRTFVLDFDEVKIKDAIEREYARGGQTLYVTPRIEFLDRIETWITGNFPNIRYGIVHAKMTVKNIEDVMTRFYERKIEILLATTIVESGIDIPSANTVIIDRSDLLGLAQLYQIRGRVGRAKTQGYAYLLTDPKIPLLDSAKRRLNVMHSLDSLGAGLQLASHDLSIRGAGNILGEEQSGHIKEVGVELYQKLLQEAILMSQAEEAGIKFDGELIPKIQIGIPVIIPSTYIESIALRLDFYKRIAGLKAEADIHKLASEMIDRFGKLPTEVNNLFAVILIKVMCINLKIKTVDIGPNGIVLLSEEKNTIDRLLSLKLQDVQVKVRPDSKIVLSTFDSTIKENVRLTTTILKKIC